MDVVENDKDEYAQNLDIVINDKNLRTWLQKENDSKSPIVVYE